MDTSGIVTEGVTLPAQLRAARGLLDWSLDRLAEASGIPKRTLIRMESGGTKPRERTALAVRTALEAAGVEFIPQNGGGPGVRLKDMRPTNKHEPLHY